MPPEHLWEDVEGLEQWWQDVEAKREDGVATSRGRKTGTDDDDPDEDRGPAMVENDYARYLKE